jgi:hypothetical protein
MSDPSNPSVVEVYRNLHRGCLSVRDPKTRLVIGYADGVLLTDVTFVVSEAGRQRVLRERRKNVHAFVRGTLAARGGSAPEGWASVRYNPFEAGTFRRAKDGEAVYRAERAYVSPSGVLVEPR